MITDFEFRESSSLSELRLAHRRRCIALAWGIHRVDEIPDRILSRWIDQLDAGKNPIDVYGRLIESTRRVCLQTASSKAVATSHSAVDDDKTIRIPPDLKGNPTLEALYLEFVSQIRIGRRRGAA